MKHLKRYNESKEFIDYERFSKDHKYCYDISQSVFKMVEDEMRDEMLEFFYSLIDDMTPESEVKLTNPNDVEYFTPGNLKKDKYNTWSYSIEKSFQNVGGHSSANTISKKYKNFIAIIFINLSNFDSNTIMSEVKSIYDNLIDSGYKCGYTYNHRVDESNIPHNGRKGKLEHSLDLVFSIHIEGDNVLSRIGIDTNKLQNA